MREYFTEALVLERFDSNDTDVLVDLYTKELGLVKVKAISGRKILSKLSPHLQPMNLVQVRLIEKNYFSIADALTKENFSRLKNFPPFFSKAVDLLHLVQILALPGEPDRRVWSNLLRAFEKKDFSPHRLLKAFGYDPLFAQCQLCEDAKPVSFVKKDQIFACRKCSSKIPKDEVLYL